MTRKTRKTNSSQQPLSFPTSRAAIYTRVSTEDQAKEGYGLDVQREKCRAMAVVKGWEVVAEFTDDGISGTKDASQRPGLAAMLNAVEEGDVDAVIFHAFDRLGRKTLIVLSLVERLATLGCEVVSVKEALDTSTPQGKFVMTMFAAIAELDRNSIVERTTAGRNARGKIDGEKGGSVPYGYIRVRDAKGKSRGLVIDPTESFAVEMIFGLRKSGLTLRQIADILNDKRIASSRGSRWFAPAVKVVLDNRDAYAGGRRGDSSVAFPAILQ